MGVVLPLILILLFGFGLSLDVKNVPVAVVMDQPSADAIGLAAGFRLSPYFQPADRPLDAAGAATAASRRRSTASFAFPSDFARQLGLGDAEVQLLVHGTDANRARIIQAYAAGRAWRTGRRSGWPRAAAAARRAGDRADPAVVQRGQRQPLLPGAGADRAGDDPDRRAAHRHGDGARMGARHARGAVRDAGAQRRDPDRQDHARISCWAWSGWCCACWRPSSCSTCRSAARSGCCRAPRCSICWWRWASAC